MFFVRWLRRCLFSSTTCGPAVYTEARLKMHNVNRPRVAKLSPSHLSWKTTYCTVLPFSPEAPSTHLDPTLYRGEHFSIELTYNHGVDGYNVGDGLNCMGLRLPDLEGIAARATKAGGEVVSGPEASRQCCCILIKKRPFCRTTPSSVGRVCIDCSILEMYEFPWPCCR